jgi:hypothetical protein
MLIRTLGFVLAVVAVLTGKPSEVAVPEKAFFSLGLLVIAGLCLLAADYCDSLNSQRNHALNGLRNEINKRDADSLLPKQ